MFISCWLLHIKFVLLKYVLVLVLLVLAIVTYIVLTHTVKKYFSRLVVCDNVAVASYVHTTIVAEKNIGRVVQKFRQYVVYCGTTSKYKY